MFDQTWMNAWNSVKRILGKLCFGGALFCEVKETSKDIAVNDIANWSIFFCCLLHDALMLQHRTIQSTYFITFTLYMDKEWQGLACTDKAGVAAKKVAQVHDGGGGLSMGRWWFKNLMTIVHFRGNARMEFENKCCKAKSGGHNAQISAS